MLFQCKIISVCRFGVKKISLTIDLICFNEIGTRNSPNATIQYPLIEWIPLNRERRFETKRLHDVYDCVANTKKYLYVRKLFPLKGHYNRR